MAMRHGEPQHEEDTKRHELHRTQRANVSSPIMT